VAPTVAKREHISLRDWPHWFRQVSSRVCSSAWHTAR
jgi:hypothetical protein